MLGWIEARRQEGWLLAYDQVRVSVSTAGLTLHFDRPSLLRSAPGGSVSWYGPELAITFPFWPRSQLLLRLPGEQNVTIAGAAPGLAARSKASDVEVTIGTEGDTGWSVQAEAGGLAVAQGLGGRELLTAPRARAWAHSDGGHGAGLRLGVRFDRVEMTEPGPFGPALEDVAIALALPVLPDGLDAPALEAWRAAGGRLVVDALGMQWGPVGLDANGALGLDPLLRPSGALSARVSGYEPALDLLIRQRRIAAENGPALKLLGRMMALTGGGHRIELPVRLEGGWLYAGPARLLALPSLDGIAVGISR